jgi:prepilin-type N-terminal cleavage/methylation domain-containing protein
MRRAAPAYGAGGRARARLNRLGAAQEGFTLTEMLVVLAILGVVLAALTGLFVSATHAESDQTQRGQAQQAARLALDKLRREIHCASTISTPSGYPASSVTITLGSWCSVPGGATTVTWCTKDKTGTAPPVVGQQPYTLWRYVAGSCTGTGTRWASNLVDNGTVAAGKIFDAAFVSAPTFTSVTTGGTLPSGTYSYEVTAVLASGAEVPGAITPFTVTSTSLTNKITVSWSAYPGAASYNVYGRDAGSVRLLKNVTVGTSYVDNGPTSLTDNPFTLPSTGSFTINVTSTSSFNSTANTIQFGASGPVTCTGTTGTGFTGCTGGQPGQYANGTPVYSVSSARPPLSTLSVSLPVDLTPADAKQRFVVGDDIALRNSR